MSIAGSGAGHGGKKTNGRWRDGGAQGNGYNEADVTRIINNKIIALTGAKDTTDNLGTSVNDNLNRIAQNINKAPDGYHLSNHLNAFNGKATGVEVLYGNVSQKAVAAKVSKAIANALGIVDRGAKDGSWLAIARGTGAGKKVLLIEWCFIDNKSDMQKLMANMDKAISAMLSVFGYSNTVQPPKTNVKPATPTAKTIDQLANEVIAGKHGTGEARKKSLGGQYDAVQKRVNEKLGAASAQKKPSKKSNDTIANEVINGKWGNGANREKRLKAAGYNPTTIQKLVNQKLGAKATAKPKVAKKTNAQIAREIYNGVGNWGTGQTRVDRLRKAGYDPVAVQREVNKLF